MSGIATAIIGGIGIISRNRLQLRDGYS